MLSDYLGYTSSQHRHIYIYTYIYTYKYKYKYKYIYRYIIYIYFNIYISIYIGRHVVSNIQVKLQTILEVGRTIINLKLEKLRVVTWKILSKSSYRVSFCNQITKIFLKAWKLDWLIKLSVLTRPRENFTGSELPELFILMVWILRVTISNFCVVTSILGLF